MMPIQICIYIKIIKSTPYIPPLPILIHLTRTTRKEEPCMSEHHDAPKTHEFHTVHEDHTKGPSNPKEINPKVSSDIAYWSKQFNVTSQALHEAIRAHGTHVDKIRAALTHHPA